MGLGSGALLATQIVSSSLARVGLVNALPLLFLCVSEVLCTQSWQDVETVVTGVVASHRWGRSQAHSTT